MPEGLRMGVSVPGANKDHRDRPKKKFEKTVTLKVLTNWINAQNWDTHTKKELIRRASAYPCNGLRYFATNINSQVTKIQEERTKLRKERYERELSMPVSADGNNQSGEREEGGSNQLGKEMAGGAFHEAAGDGHATSGPVPS